MRQLFQGFVHSPTFRVTRLLSGVLRLAPWVTRLHSGVLKLVPMVTRLLLVVLILVTGVTRLLSGVVGLVSGTNRDAGVLPRPPGRGAGIPEAY